MIKTLLILIFSFYAFYLVAQEAQPLKQFDSMNQKANLSQEAKIFSLTGNLNGISLKNIKVAKPNMQSLKKYGLISRKDKYAISVLDEKGSQVMLIGLGDPFTLHIDHIGYEDQGIYQTNISQDIEIAIPLSIDAAYFVLLSQDKFGFKEIKKIKVK